MNINVEWCAFSFHGVCVHTSNVSLSVCFVYGTKINSDVYICILHVSLVQCVYFCRSSAVIHNVLCCVSVAI